MTHVTPPVVQMTGIDKQFHGFPVLREVSLDLHGGEVHVLAGENGAGKSTLMRILAGIHRPDAGTVEIAGEAVEIHDPRQARALGIGIVHQELSLAPNLSVAENLSLGREPRRVLRFLDRRRATGDAAEMLSRVGADFAPTARVEDLSAGQQQLVEIGRALAERPRVLIFDEPTASLSEHEAQRLLTIVRAMRDDGLAVVYITHRMEEIGQLADRVTVLRDGVLVGSLEPERAAPERIVTLMVGRPISSLFVHARPAAGVSRLEVRGLTDGAGIAPTDLTVRAGEIVGLAGLIGSGRSELARLIFGADPAADGEVRVDGELVDVSHPAAAMRSGIALLPESRKEQGLLLQLSVAENICLSTLAGFSRGGVLDSRRVKREAGRFVEEMRIKAGSLDQPVEDLSGGNQQKVLLARCLALRPKVLILDEPTRGVDIAAKAEIYRLIDEVAAEGVAVLLISSELPEVLGMSDRVHVMRQGRIVAELLGDQLKEEIAMRYATGVDIAETATAASDTGPATEVIL